MLFIYDFVWIHT